MTPACSRQHWISSWPIVRAALIFAALFATVLISWLPDAAGRSLAQRFDVLLLLLFLGIVVALTLEPAPPMRRARRAWRLRFGLVARRRK